MRGEITPFLSWFEFCRTDVRRYWDEQFSPPQNVQRNARRIGALFDPARKLWGVTGINSGWRCPGLNANVGGSKDSLHLEGLALDVVPRHMDLFDAFVAASQLPLDVFPYDMMIFELGAWIHLQATRKTSYTPRRLIRMRWADTKAKTGKDLEPWDPADPRVQRVRKSPKLAEAPGP